MATVSFDEVTKVYDGGQKAVDRLSLEIADGEFMVFVGPSGCGKTTALRCVAGLEQVTDGEIRIGDRVVNDLEAEERDIAMVFQNYALYPHMRVRDNMAFGLRMQKVPKRDIASRVDAIASVLGLGRMLDRKPRQLSGGQRQRVAMGRAMVREPQVFLMDEPLSNLDARLRVQMRAEVARTQRQLRITTIYVTHDQVEAMTMGDRVAVMRAGVVQQVAEPQELFDRPANLFVASFIGSPPMNLVEARLEFEGDGAVAWLGDQPLRLGAELVRTRPELREYRGRVVGLGLRPEHLHGRAEARSGREPSELRGEVVTVEALGTEYLVHVEVAGNPVTTAEVLEVAGDVDAAAREELEGEARTGRTTLVARVGVDEPLSRSGEVRLHVDPLALHFFDLESGRAIAPVAAAVPVAAGRQDPELR
jgi:multiple sugar transport system ATP-binding protein